MAELDAIVAECRGHGTFATGVVRDTSNRFNRDWRWWSVEIERTDSDGIESRRITAEVRLNEPAPGIPSTFDGRWSARIWQGVSTDSFRAGSNLRCPWITPSAQELEKTMSALLAQAENAIRSHHPNELPPL